MGCSCDLQHVLQVLRARTWTQSAVEQGFRPVDDDLGGVKIVLAAQAMTLGARAIRAIERERARLELGDVDAAVGTCQARGVERLLSSDYRDLYQPTRQLHRQPDGHFQSMLDSGFYQQAVDHHLDGVILALVQIDFVLQVQQFSIHTGASKAVLHQLLHFLLEFAFYTPRSVCRTALSAGAPSHANPRSRSSSALCR